MFLAPRDLVQQTHDAFVRLHAAEPTALARASGRVNLIGEHVDYLAGRCLPIAIPYATWVALTPRDDDRVVLTSAAAERYEGRRGQPATGWARYVTAALDESTWTGGITLHVESTVPLGAGLSSSAALICAVLRAVDERSNHDVVEPAIRAETTGVGAPTGGLDQSASLLAQNGQALLLDFAGGRPVHLPWNPSAVGLELLVVDTGVRHANDGGDFARVRDEAERAMAAEPTDPVLQRRRRHVESEKARVQDVVDAVVRGDWRAVGVAFTASHASLRDDHEVSCAELDTAVADALEAGALGARMTGGGFGGSAIILAPVEARQQIVDSVEADFAARGWSEPVFMLGDAEGPATRLG